jgi:hypothetical protein
MMKTTIVWSVIFMVVNGMGMEINALKIKRASNMDERVIFLTSSFFIVNLVWISG